MVDNSRDGWAHKQAHKRAELPTIRDPDHHNLGTSRSWNIGARHVLEHNLDYLVLVSSSIRFGPILHTTWTRQMSEFWGAKVIEATGLSWKLIALHRTCFERIGLFDPAFWPGYFEAIDWCRRLHLIGWEQGFVHVWANAMAATVGEYAHMVLAQPLLDHYASKWGGPKGEETFVLPYGNRPLDHVVEEPIPVLAERYGLDEKGIAWW